MWVQRIHTEVLRLASRCLYLQSHLNSPVFKVLLVGKVESMIAYFILLHQLIHFTRVWVHTSAHVGVREQLWESALSSSHLGLGDQAHIIRLGAK